MNLTTLDNNLRELGDRFNFVNHGGCACVASMLAKQLRDTYPVMRITSCNAWSDSDNNIDEIRPNMCDSNNKEEWWDNGIQFAHVWVEIFVDGNWLVLDSEGVHSTEDMYSKWGIPAEGSFTIDEVTALSNKLTWNETFDRSQLPAMQELITATIN